MWEMRLALLRGVNVGGKNKLSMKELAGIFADAGCEDIRTYIQSGNVLFRSELDSEPLAETISLAIQERLGLKIPLVLRTKHELTSVASANPFLAEAVAVDSLHVVFLTDWPSHEAAASLDPNRSHPDRFALIGRELFLHLPTGAANTKLSNAYFDSRLRTVSTGRNWRTVTKLLEMMKG